MAKIAIFELKSTGSEDSMENLSVEELKAAKGGTYGYGYYKEEGYGYGYGYKKEGYGYGKKGDDDGYGKKGHGKGYGKYED